MKNIFLSLCNSLNEIVRPRFLPFCVGLLGVVSFFVWLEVKFIPEEWERLPIQAISPSTKKIDEYAGIGYTATHTKRDKRPTMLVVGGSSAREAFLPKEKMETLLKETTNADWRFVNLASSDQTMAESLALIDTADLDPGSVILVNISPSRLRNDKQSMIDSLYGHQLFFLDYSGVEEFFESRETDIAWVPTIHKNRYWVSRVVNNAVIRNRYKDLKGPFWNRVREIDRETCGFGLGCLWSLFQLEEIQTKNKFNPQRYAAGKPQPERKARLITTFLSRYFAPIVENMKLNMRLLRSLVIRSERRGFKVLVFSLPKDPSFQFINRVVDNRFRPYIDDILERTDATYEDWTTLEGFDESDFYDHTHVLGQGQAKFSEFFAGYFRDEMLNDQLVLSSNPL